MLEKQVKWNKRTKRWISGHASGSTRNILAGKTKTPGLGLIRAGEGTIRAVHDI